MSCSSAARRAVLARRAELVGHHRGQVGALDRVREHVLAVARAELQAAEDADQLGVEALDVGVERGLLAGLDDVALELGLGLVVGLLDPGRVDAAVREQLLERHAGDLAADAVEAGEDHGVGRVVDDEVDAGEVLEGADVAALAADDAALHVVGGELDDGHRRLGRVAGGEALHARRRGCCGRGGRRRAWSPPRSGARAGRESWRIWSSSSLSRSCLACEARQAGDALELAHVALAQLDDLGLVLLDGRLAAWRARALLVERRLLRQQALLEPHHLGAPLLEVGVCAGRRDCRRVERPGRLRRWLREPASAGARRESSEAATTRPAASTTAAITISIFGSSPGRRSGPSSLCSGCARPGSRHRARESCSEGGPAAATSDGG